MIITGLGQLHMLLKLILNYVGHVVLLNLDVTCRLKRSSEIMHGCKVWATNYIQKKIKMVIIMDIIFLLKVIISFLFKFSGAETSSFR